MTPQETQALDAFLAQLTQARATGKDPQAAAMIADAVARQPDAAYLLVQRAMLLDHALASAKAQIAALENQLQAAQGGGNNAFLDPNAWGAHPSRPAATMPTMAPPPQQMPQQAAPPYQAQPQQPQYQPQPATPPSRGGFLSGGFGSTLGSIATTAAGVAGGAMLFQGIENLFHRNSGSGFLGQPLAGVPQSETVVNNYYGNGDSPLDAPGANWSADTGNAGGSDGLLDAGLDDGSFLDDDDSTYV